MPDEQDWIIVGDFNLMRSPNNRNRLGGDVTKMLLFNEAISSLGIVELPLQGKVSLGRINSTLLCWNV